MKMSQTVKGDYPDSPTSKIIAWGKLISITGSAQLIVQAVGFASGIMIIRLLPTKEYAFYVLANTMLGTMTLLADGGIATGVLAQGAKVWNDRQKLGVVIATGLELRKKFAIGSLLISTPILVYLLRYHNASWLMTFLISLSLIPAFLSALSDELLEIAPKLKQDIVPLQKNQMLASLTRLLMLGATLFFFPWTFVAILDSGISRAWANIRLRKISITYADRNQSSDAQVQKGIIKTVKRVLPTSIYYCLSSQITIWLISIFGSTKSLAQVGALSGLSTALTLFNIVFNTIVVPRFARLPGQLTLVLKRFFLIQAVLWLVGLIIAIVVWFFSKNILWILGHNFSSLNKELVLVAAGSSVTLISGCTSALLSSRGIIVPPTIYIPTIIVIQVGLAFVVPIDKVVGVLLYGIYTSVFVYVIRMIYFLAKVKVFDHKEI
jgi:O-antigen/teichoic acid export membrane protein